MTGSEWNEDEQGPPAPLPAHERAWRHPSEMGLQAWQHSEPPLTIGRGLTIATGTVGCLLAFAVLWTMLPTEAGRGAVATARSTTATRAETGLVADRSVASADPTVTTVPATSVPVAPTTGPVAQIEPDDAVPDTAPQRPMPTYQLQQSTDLAPGAGAVAVAVSGGSLVITTAEAVTADLTVELLLPDGRIETARVLFVDDRSGLAVLAPGAATSIESFTVATVVEPGDQLTFFGDEQMTVTIGDDGVLDATWAADESIREGAPVVNQRGELVALCTHRNGVDRLVQLTNLDELQQAITSFTGVAKVWLGIVLSDDPAGEVGISAVDPSGPAAAAGLTSGDVIITVDDAPVADGKSLTALLAAHRPGQVVRLGVRRADDSLVSLSVTLAEPKTTL